MQIRFYFYGLLVFFLSMLFYAGFGQKHQSNNFVKNKHLDDTLTNHLFLNIDNGNFFKNNEYTGPFLKGYTYTGYFINSGLVYLPADGTKIRLGGFLLDYHGREAFAELKPVVALQQRLTPWLDIVFGNIYGNLNHYLAEPLYRFDNYIDNHMENGVQFLINGGFINADIWIDWEKFILPDDPFREKFTYGTTVQIRMLDNESWGMAMPLQTLIMHKGGQIDASEEPVETLVNAMVGVDLEKKITGGFLNKLSFQPYYFVYNDLTDNNTRIFQQGYAIYPGMELSSNLFDIKIGYWEAKTFIAPKALELYQSVSRNDPCFFERDRKLLTSRIMLHKRFSESIDFGISLRNYYDLNSKKMEYSYGLYLLFDHSFFITEPK
jgi:hypothetical protein